MGMLDKDSLQAIREIMKEEIRFQNEHIDSKLQALKNYIHKDMTEFHQEIIADIGNVENKLAELIGTQSKDIQKLKLKVG